MEKQDIQGQEVFVSKYTQTKLARRWHPFVKLVKFPHEALMSAKSSDSDEHSKFKVMGDHTSKKTYNKSRNSNSNWVTLTTDNEVQNKGGERRDSVSTKGFSEQTKKKLITFRKRGLHNHRTTNANSRYKLITKMFKIKKKRVDQRTFLKLNRTKLSPPKGNCIKDRNLLAMKITARYKRISKGKFLGSKWFFSYYNVYVNSSVTYLSC